MSGYLSDIIQRNALPASGQAPSSLLTPVTGLSGAFWQPPNNVDPELTEIWNETALYPPAQIKSPTPDPGVLTQEDISPAGALQPPAPLYIERHFVRADSGAPDETLSIIREKHEVSNYSSPPADSQSMQTIRLEPGKLPDSPAPGNLPAGQHLPGKTLEMIRPVGDLPLIKPLAPAANTAPHALPEKKGPAAPKLVIGKMTVEVVSQVPKIQTAMHSAHRPEAPPIPKASPQWKLTFGLGQL
jgi:hypothetical protein